jgi:hypothetical protein
MVSSPAPEVSNVFQFILLALKMPFFPSGILVSMSTIRMSLPIGVFQ